MIHLYHYYHFCLVIHQHMRFHVYFPFKIRFLFSEFKYQHLFSHYLSFSILGVLKQYAELSLHIPTPKKTVVSFSNKEGIGLNAIVADFFINAPVARILLTDQGVVGCVPRLLRLGQKGRIPVCVFHILKHLTSQNLQSVSCKSLSWEHFNKGASYQHQLIYCMDHLSCIHYCLGHYIQKG